ncbi:Odorant degrading enzyme CXE9 [Operophtera brumata]|uniref:Carboxylic ester hydrolase n=1 Tax=Operophtera brumata TaxID=104452 RepID=A0A0L7LKF4_OPEBR|nr:Odorant degrading enzyme CXE9 [Operophtera brumata]
MIKVPDEENCVVQTKDGPVFGFIEKIDDGVYYKFKGIPYAKPPVGSLRFLSCFLQPPAPIQPWTELKDCTKDVPLPLSIDLAQEVTGSEDCLYIEISSPSIQPDKPLPVMFWIGCYCFAYLADGIYDPTFINSQDVVFVRCGYRLGPLGFLSVNDFTAPGNSGLKDIVMALKWVQRNISAFGGDPTNVTLFGNSAGGAMVHFMMLSPMATGLFHKAIIQSACALNNWSLAKNPSQPVMELAKLLGIKTTYKIEIVEELKSVSAMAIMEAFALMCRKSKEEDENQIIDAVFKPCIEIEFEGQPAFLTRSAPSLLKSGNFYKVPLIIGSNNIEGAVLQYFKQDFYKDFQKYNDNVCLLVPKSLGGEEKITKSIGQQLVKFYMGGEEQLREDTKSQYLQLVSDYYFLYYVNRTVRLHTQFAPECPVYYYIINYAGEWTVPNEYDYFNSMGHSAEIPFIFGLKMADSPICKGSRDSVKTRSRVVKMWTNFAKYG